HIGFFLGFAPLFVLALELLPFPTGWPKLIAIGFCLASWLTTVVTLESYYFLGVKVSLLQPFNALVQNARTVFNWGAYKREMSEQLNQVRKETQLPIVSEIVGRATLDVFGQEQSYAVFTGLNYRPRPIFQSYMAYNPALTRM